METYPSSPAHALRQYTNDDIVLGTAVMEEQSRGE